MASSSVNDVATGAAADLVLDEVVQLGNDPKYTKPLKYDKEAWRGDDENEQQDEQHFAKPINLEF